jgi:hypothetical protein
MTTTQLFLSLAGLIVAVFGSQIIMVKMYVDAKIDGTTATMGTKIGGLETNLGTKIAGLETNLDTKIAGLETNLGTKIGGLSKTFDLLVQYMITHEGKIAILEERTKGKAS